MDFYFYRSPSGSIAVVKGVDFQVWDFKDKSLYKKVEAPSLDEAYYKFQKGGICQGS